MPNSDKSAATIGERSVLIMRSGVSSQNDMEYGSFKDADMANAVGRLLLEADAKDHPEWNGFDVVQLPNQKAAAWIDRNELEKMTQAGHARVGDKFLPGDLPLYLDPMIASVFQHEPNQGENARKVATLAFHAVGMAKMALMKNDLNGVKAALEGFSDDVDAVYGSLPARRGLDKDSVVNDLKARFAAVKSDTVQIDREEFNTLRTIIDLLEAACDWRGKAVADARDALTKISLMCPSDPDADQLDTSPESMVRLHNAEVGDTARAGLMALSTPWIERQQATAATRCPGNYGHADGCTSASASHPYSVVLSCCRGRNLFTEYAGKGYIVVKEHVWEHDDGGRPTLAYLWPSEFNRQVFFTFEDAHAFINAEPGLPLGWVAMQIQFPEMSRG